MGDWETLGKGEQTHLDMLIYGRSGAGKTPVAATAPQPLFCLAADPTGHKAIPYPTPGTVIHSLGDYKEVISFFHEGGHGFRTLLVDGLSFLHDLFLHETGNEFAKKGGSDPDLMPIQGRMKINNQFKKFIRNTIDLTQVEDPDDRVHVIFTTLEERVKESEDAPFSIRPLIGTKGMNEYNPAFFTIVAYLRPRGGGENKKKGQLDQTREMLFVEHAGIQARDRLGIMPHYLEGFPLSLSGYLK